MMYRTIVTALIDLVVFLEFSPEELVDPDATVEALEQLGETLQSAPHDVRKEFVEAVELVAGGYGDKADFVRSLPENLGLL